MNQHDDRSRVVLRIPDRSTTTTHTLVATIGLTILGGALCGLASMGIFSVGFFAFSVPLGGVAGFLLGVPLALVLALIFDRHACPPTDPRGFTRALQATGAVLGCAAAIVANVALAGLFSRTSPPVLAIANAAVGVSLAGIVGYWCGWGLARGHLALFGLDPDSPPPQPCDGAHPGQRLWTVELRAVPTDADGPSDSSLWGATADEWVTPEDSGALWWMQRPPDRRQPNRRMAA